MTKDCKTPTATTNQRAPLANQKATEIGKLEEELMPLEEEEKPTRTKISLWINLRVNTRALQLIEEIINPQ
nr:hypothetical protein [Tanacetum cinerariifolium]